MDSKRTDDDAKLLAELEHIADALAALVGVVDEGFRGLIEAVSGAERPAERDGPEAPA